MNMMQSYQFYAKFANLPFKDRTIPLDEGLRMLDIYSSLKMTEDKIRDDVIHIQGLLKIAEKGFEQLNVK